MVLLEEMDIRVALKKAGTTLTCKMGIVCQVTSYKIKHERTEDRSMQVILKRVTRVICNRV